jgi:hypothetical protein
MVNVYQGDKTNDLVNKHLWEYFHTFIVRKIHMYVIIYACQCVNQSNMTGPHVLIMNLHLWKDSKLLYFLKSTNFWPKKLMKRNIWIVKKLSTCTIKLVPVTQLTRNSIYTSIISPHTKLCQIYFYFKIIYMYIHTKCLVRHFNV